MLELLEHMREQGFIRSDLEVKYLVAESVDEILPMLNAAIERNRARGLVQEEVRDRL